MRCLHNHCCCQCPRRCSHTHTHTHTHRHVASGPMVRSFYKAGEFFLGGHNPGRQVAGGGGGAAAAGGGAQRLTSAAAGADGTRCMQLYRGTRESSGGYTHGAVRARADGAPINTSSVHAHARSSQRRKPKRGVWLQQAGMGEACAPQWSAAPQPCLHSCTHLLPREGSPRQETTNTKPTQCTHNTTQHNATQHNTTPHTHTLPPPCDQQASSPDAA
jgi:hypothetical protein